MPMKRRRRRRIWLALPLLVLAALVLAWRSLLPAIEDLAAAEATDEASDLIAEAITAQMELEDISYDDLIVLERDAGGRINERILDEGETELGVPLGSILLPALFSGKGPRLPVRVLTVSNSDAEFHSSFQAAGINQTMHRITMEVAMNVTLLTPAGTQTLRVDSGVVVAETILIGQVPSTVIQTEGKED